MQFDHDYERIVPTSLVAGMDSITFGGTAGVNIPAGTTATRPAAPVAGSLRFSTTGNTLEWYTGSAWVSPSMVTPGGASTNVQYNSAGSFGGTSTFVYDTITDSTKPYLSVLAPLNSSGAVFNLLRLSQRTTAPSFSRSPGSAAIYVESTGDAFQMYWSGSGRFGTGTLTWDNAPVLTLLESSNFVPYLNISTVGTGTESAPQHVMKFGALSSYKSFSSNAGAIAGWQWVYNGTYVAGLQPGAFMSPTGASSGRPGVVEAGLFRYNTDNTGFEGYIAGSVNAWANIIDDRSRAANTVLAAPTAGAGSPTFRALALANNDLADVVVTSPSVGQVLAWNGTDFVNSGAVGSNAAGLVGAGQSGAAAWTLSSGRYIADFAHGLNTMNVVVTVFDTATNAVVIPDLVQLTSTTNVRITASTNTRTLRVVVVANGQSIAAGGSTPSSVITSKDGVTVTAAATKLNFTGQIVSVTDAGSGVTNVNVGQRFTYFANSLDNPVNSDFAVNALAPVVTDSAYPSINQRSFSATVEQGVGFFISIPSNATTITFKLRGRSSMAVGTTSPVIQPRLYVRQIPDTFSIGSWSAAKEFANVPVVANANFSTNTQTFTLASLGLVAGYAYQCELTRRVGVATGNNLGNSWYMTELTVELY